MKENIKVAVRILPEDFLPSEVSLEENTIEIVKSKQIIKSSFNVIFQDEASQLDVFEFVSNSVLGILDGINCTVFAYGQTGSGKTYTMFGTDLQPGVIPNAIEALFNSKSNISMHCSFLQIYNEHVYDLLKPPKDQRSLRIRESIRRGIFTEGLGEYLINSEEDCKNLLEIGNQYKAVRQTRMNEQSSRSHTIFQIVIQNTNAKANFCDLAGSEKSDKSARLPNNHMREMNQINKSLSTLGKVIFALSKMSKHIPYRDSKLTRFLQDSLGNRTVLLATISLRNIDESISTLKFADRAKRVMVSIKKSNKLEVDSDYVCKLKKEIVRLKQLLYAKNDIKEKAELSKKIRLLREENNQLKLKALSERQANNTFPSISKPKIQIIPDSLPRHYMSKSSTKYKKKLISSSTKELWRINERFQRLIELDMTRKEKFRKALEDLEFKRKREEEDKLMRTEINRQKWKHLQESRHRFNGYRSHN